MYRLRLGLRYMKSRKLDTGTRLCYDNKCLNKNIMEIQRNIGRVIAIMTIVAMGVETVANLYGIRDVVTNIDGIHRGGSQNDINDRKNTQDSADGGHGDEPGE